MAQSSLVRATVAASTPNVAVATVPTLPAEPTNEVVMDGENAHKKCTISTALTNAIAENQLAFASQLDPIHLLKRFPADIQEETNGFPPLE